MRVAKKPPFDTLKYYSINTADTFGLDQTLSYSLLNKNYNSNYEINEPPIYSYDGWAYVLYYHTTKGRSMFIEFIPNELPDSLKYTFAFVERIFKKQDLVTGSKFKWPDIIEKEAIVIFKKHPQVPPPAILERKIKFIAPKKLSNK